ncbi:MAG: TPR end-of-group domain-containing protein, partial [Tepidisphaeraceae bacterium]
PIIDECVLRASGKVVDPRLIPTLMHLRLQHFERMKHAAGCLETADKWEALKRTDAASLYKSASFRAACAAVIREMDKTPAGEAKAKEQADQAMAWLRQAVAAGYGDAAQIEKDSDLDALRDRDDFKTLLLELQSQIEKTKTTSPSTATSTTP